MYEAEVNHSTESVETLPADIRSRFAEFRDQVALRTLLPWGEHCTECAWPTCYTTCDLYAAREDGACRQFIDGAVRIDHKEGLNPYLIKIRFKQWAKLWTVGNLRLEPLSKAGRKELINIAVGAIGRGAPMPDSLRPRVLQKISYLRRVSAEKARGNGVKPDCFLLECFNPNPRNINLTFTLRARNDGNARPFQDAITLSPGYNRSTIEFSNIARAVDFTQPFEIEIVPNDCENTVLYFGLMDFVKHTTSLQPAAQPPPASQKPLKCIVWDLDNTLWDGILIEDGAERIRIREAVVKVIRDMDQRGVLHSIASKNNEDDVLSVLRRHSLEEYFLYPQIKWAPKSQSIAAIAQLLNIGIESMAFVDDQAFEREEVRNAFPQVAVIDALEAGAIPDRPDCNLPVTAEAKSRRLMYREQQQRETALASFSGNYTGFLKDCRIEVIISPLRETNLKRVYELAQRTNQMNFSGNRYAEAELLGVMKNPALETYVIECNDRFGQYGIVGFAVVDSREPRLLDLMFSCRVQAKRVEHAVLTFMLKRFVTRERGFYANYRKTTKNAPSGKVFEEMGFEAAGEQEGVTALVFPRGRDIPDDGIVKISALTGELV